MITAAPTAAADPIVRTRHHLASRRDAADRVLERAVHLAPADRLLLEQVYRHGLSAAEVARLTRQPTRTLQRRVQRLLTHLADPLFAYVAARLELLPPETHPVAQYAILQGHSLRRTARLTGQSLHRVRQHLDTIRTLARHT
ncbi:MAG: hypothetical protein WD534_03565 [Phycisphaeraceae bacterium]